MKITGRVVSTKMEKTVTVLVESRKTHPLYKKTYGWSKKYLVDDQIGVSLGDIVEIVKVAPVSKRKHFRITKVIGKDLVALGEAHLKEKTEEAIARVMPEEEKEELKESGVMEESKVEGKEEKEEKPKAKKVKEPKEKS